MAVAEVGAPTSHNVASVNAVSQAPLVRQALASKDEKLWHVVFSKKDLRVLESTVSELSGTEAFDLLQEATARLYKYPSVATEVSYWMKQVLITHATYFMASPSFKSALQPLYETIRTRVSNKDPFMETQATLIPILNAHRDKAKPSDVQEPLVKYEEGDEEVEISETEDESENEDGIDGDIADLGSGMDDDGDSIDDLMSDDDF